MASYKFYVVEFTNKHYPTPEGMVFLKFGITHHMKVEYRFDPSIDDGYPKNYKDWNIRVLFSIKCKTKQEAEMYEKYYLNTKFPYKSKYKVWVEDIFGLEDRNKYYDNTGVTELRLVSVEEKKSVLNRLFNHKESKAA